MHNFIFQKILKLFFKNEGLSAFCYSIFITILGIGILSYPIFDNLIIVVISSILLFFLYSINLFIEIKLNGKFNFTVLFHSFLFLKSDKFISYFGEFYIIKTKQLDKNHKRFSYFNDTFAILNNNNKLNSIKGYPSYLKYKKRLYQWHSNGVLIHTANNHEDIDEKQFNILKNKKFFDF